MGGKLPISVTVILPTLNEEKGIKATIDALPRDWCEDLEILVIDGNSKDDTVKIAKQAGAKVHIESRKGYGRAYRTGFAIASNDVIITMDADATYPAEVIPDLVKTLIDDDLDFITCDRLKKAEMGSMSGMHGFGNRVLSWTARFLFWYGIKDSQSGMWVFYKRVFENKKVRPTHDGMPLSEEIKILAARHLGKKKVREVSVPYRPRVGDAEIQTWNDGMKNLLFLWRMRFGMRRELTPWGENQN